MGQYVVCHGFWDDNRQRVCLVGDDGEVTRSYGNEGGSDVGQSALSTSLGCG